MTDQSALVLGASGVLGSELVKKLKSNGLTVFGVDLKFPEFEKSAADVFLIGDLRDPHYCDRIFKRFEADMVFQMAHPPLSFDDAAESMKNTLAINANILDSMIKFGKDKILFRSQLRETASDADELTDSALTYLTLERLYQNYARNCGLNIKIARVQEVYGPGTDHLTSQLARQICEREANEVLMLDARQSDAMSFIFKDDVVEQLLPQIFESSEVIQVFGDPKSYTISEIVSLLCQAAEKNIQTIWSPQNPDSQEGPQFVDEMTTGAKTRLSDGLKQTYQWIQSFALVKGSQIHSEDERCVENLGYDFFR